MVEKYSEPLVGNYPEEFRIITLFNDQEAIYRFFMIGNEDGIQGEFENLVRLNFDSPLSYAWFA
jgi:hypothetical protein